LRFHAALTPLRRTVMKVAWDVEAVDLLDARLA
jgi:hypothetical protein